MNHLGESIRELIDTWAQGLERRPVRIGSGPIFLVPSHSDDGFYVVAQVYYTFTGERQQNTWVCSCPDFRFAGERPAALAKFPPGEYECKHITEVKTPEIGGRPTSSTTASGSKPQPQKQRASRTTSSSTGTRSGAKTGSSSKSSASAQSKSSTQRRRSGTAASSKSGKGSTTKTQKRRKTK